MEEISRWKATELRQKLLYTGPLVFKNSISEKSYSHFMCLNIAMIILISPSLHLFIEFAKQLLMSFVKNFQIIYGKHLISHNVHGLLHLCEDYNLFGPLDNVSCFPFENFLKKFKVMLRKHDRPLEQIIKRFKELEINCSVPNSNHMNTNINDIVVIKNQHKNGPLPISVQGSQFKTLILKHKLITLKINSESNCYFGTLDNNIIKAINIVQILSTDQIMVVGKMFTVKKLLYKTPIKSNKFGIFIVKDLSTNFQLYSIDQIVKKYIVILSYGKSNDNIAISVLHTE